MLELEEEPEAISALSVQSILEPAEIVTSTDAVLDDPGAEVVSL